MTAENCNLKKSMDMVLWQWVEHWPTLYRRSK